MTARIVFNTWPGAYFNMGGGEFQLLHTMKALRKLGYDISLFDMWNPQRDVRLLHQFSIEAGVSHVVNAYKQMGTPVALSTIMWDIPDDDAFKGYLRGLFSNVDVLLTNSDMESNRISRILDLDIDMFMKTRNAISDEYVSLDVKSDFREQYNIDGKFILSVANIDRRKNTDRLLEACNEVGYQLVMIGHIRDHEYFDSFRDRFDKYKYIGPLLDVDLLKSAYQQCEIFALPSTCETPGIAALEAGSQTAKIVITSEGSTSEYFGSMVTYVNPYDVADIVRGMKCELLLQRDGSLRNHILQNYTWDKTALDIIGAYQLIM